jgi:zinc and cadmium transporter
MTTLAWIVLATVLGGVASVLAAAVVSLTAPKRWVAPLISFAIGALLGAAFLEILPHALDDATQPRRLTATVLGGILGFFLLEKLVLWRHCHTEHCEAHEPEPHGHDHARPGLVVLVGDSFHNFVDGVLIAAAFMESTSLGIVTAAAVIAHEIPQEIGNFVILLHSGFGKAKAFALNLLSSLAMVVGAVLAYFSLQSTHGVTDTLLALAAASMIYVAMSDLIPGLHKRPELRATLHQGSLIALGIATIWVTGRLTHAH